MSSDVMTSPANKPNKFRLQISLRMLLLLMAAVGVSLAVFRWPWEETKQHQIGKDLFQGDIADYVTKSTYHRNWRGLPVLHGQMLVQRNKQLRVENNYYDGELHGPRRVYDHRGRLLWEAHYRNGMLHGAFRAGNGEHWYWSGEYWADQPHGQWEFITYRPTQQFVAPPQPSEFHKAYFFFAKNEAIIARRKEKDVERLFIHQHQAWQRGQRHGLWKWKTHEGELLNAAVYEDDNFVRWNGAPVVEQFWDWLQTAPLHAETKRLLFASEHVPAKRDFESTEELCFRLVGAKEDALPLVVYTERVQGSFFHLPPGDRALVPMLCELACTNGYAFDCRYGTLWLVPNVDPAPAFVDRTGVMQIRFPEGSPQARDWLAEVEVQESYGPPDAFIEKLLVGSSIGIDGGIAIDQQLSQRTLRNNNPQFNYNLYMAQRGFRSRGFRSLPSLQRSSRRDAIGLVLHRAGYRCELRGDDKIKLIAEQSANGYPFE
jgi:antitoxin component YwqK of YwqJK toxin-antitoxin module